MEEIKMLAMWVGKECGPLVSAGKEGRERVDAFANLGGALLAWRNVKPNLQRFFGVFGGECYFFPQRSRCSLCTKS